MTKQELWEANKDFLRSEGIKSLDDSQGFYNAICGYEQLLESVRGSICQHSICDSFGYKDNLRRLEDIWEQLEEIEEEQAGDYEFYCNNCASVVEIDAEKCPCCGNTDF